MHSDGGGETLIEQVRDEFRFAWNTTGSVLHYDFMPGYGSRETHIMKSGIQERTGTGSC